MTGNEKENAIKALEIIKAICTKNNRCSNCPFSIGIVCLISQTETIPRDWEIGVFESGKLLR